MTPEAQRIAIAEACGWKGCKVDCVPVYCDDATEPGEVMTHPVRGMRVKNGFRENIPDYPNDLNAMHEAEKTVPHLPYLYRLQEVCGDRMETSGDLAKIIRATAAQRAEAFLRCIGKWTE